jgi:hypothetical protein
VTEEEGCTITVPVGSCSTGIGNCPSFHIRCALLYDIPCCFAHKLIFINPLCYLNFRNFATSPPMVIIVFYRQGKLPLPPAKGYTSACQIRNAIEVFFGEGECNMVAKTVLDFRIIYGKVII